MKLPFCTCKDEKCPLNPVNHARGCDFCIAKCLKEKEIPSCFFHKVSNNEVLDKDYSFAGFARFVVDNGN